MFFTTSPTSSFACQASLCRDEPLSSANQVFDQSADELVKAPTPAFRNDQSINSQIMKDETRSKLNFAFDAKTPNEGSSTIAIKNENQSPELLKTFRGESSGSARNMMSSVQLEFENSSDRSIRHSTVTDNSVCRKSDYCQDSGVNESESG